MSNSAELWSIAAAEQEAGDSDRRVVVLRRLLEVERAPAVLVALAAAARRAGDLQTASDYLIEALALDSSYATNHPAYTALMALKRAKGGHGELDDAREIGLRLLDVRPSDAYAMNAVGGIESDAGNYEQAEHLADQGRATRAQED